MQCNLDVSNEFSMAFSWTEVASRLTNFNWTVERERGAGRASERASERARKIDCKRKTLKRRVVGRFGGWARADGDVFVILFNVAFQNFKKKAINKTNIYIYVYVCTAMECQTDFFLYLVIEAGVE